MPRVSIVMGVYHDAAHLHRAIACVRSQTYADWELVAINDGSRDNSGAILDQAARDDARIRVIHQENAGLTRALIRGCQAAAGEYIARQDADDLSEPERLAKQVALLDSRADVGFVSCFTRYVGPSDEPLEVIRRPTDPDEATERLPRLLEGPPAHGSVMFRRSLYEAVGGYRAEFYFGQDSDLWLRMIERAKIGYVPEVLYDFRVHEGSISGRNQAAQLRFGELSHACRQARRDGKSEQPFLDEAAELKSRVLADRGAGIDDQASSLGAAYRIGAQLSRLGDRRAATYLWRVIRKQPWNWKAWIRLAQSQTGALRPGKSSRRGELNE
jgi:glycosyltransferase involved in cell wall biosynthesis